MIWSHKNPYNAGIESIEGKAPCNVKSWEVSPLSALSCWVSKTLLFLNHRWLLKTLKGTFWGEEWTFLKECQILELNLNELVLCLFVCLNFKMVFGISCIKKTKLMLKGTSKWFELIALLDYNFIFLLSLRVQQQEWEKLKGSMVSWERFL